jgi:hypothetical protein
MQTKQQAGTDAANLKKELAQEEKAIRKAQSMELLRTLNAKLLKVQNTKLDAIDRETKLLSIKEEIYTAYSTGDITGLDQLSTKLNGLGY